MENEKAGKYQNLFSSSLFDHLSNIFNKTEAELKEFEWRLKFKPPLKYVWFNLKLYFIFQDLSRRLIETGFGEI